MTAIRMNSVNGKKGPNPEGIEAYANSQLYTDWLLQQIYTYGKDNLNLQAMVYFSDHGESVEQVPQSRHL